MLSPAIYWDPAQGHLSQEQLEGFDAVVHLAGESIAEGRWTAAKKKRILDSRVQGTKLLSETLARLKNPPRVLVVASAIGYYGDRGGEILTESSSRGSDFLAEVCEAWERAAQPAKEKGIRVVHPRIGIVLGKGGGALAKMLLPFKLGLGGRLGSGNQYMSWIALEDLVGVIQFALNHSALNGPVNAVSPAAATNNEFTKTLGRVLNRPTIFPAPAFALKLLLGEMAQALLLSSANVKPQKLLETKYPFKFAGLEPALRNLLINKPE
jgi:uncharacterized protein (TIGR01777 family)